MDRTTVLTNNKTYDLDVENDFWQVKLNYKLYN